MKKVLNVGGNNKTIPLPAHFAGFEHFDIDDVLYQSPAGPIMVLDVLYGHCIEIEQSGQEFFAHKTGFTQKSLLSALQKAGFSKIYTEVSGFEINALAFKGVPDQATRTLFGLPDE